MDDRRCCAGHEVSQERGKYGLKRRSTLLPAPPDFVQITTMNQQGIGTNVAFFSGHGTARTEIMGLEDRAPTAAELDAMRDFVENEMRAGALGLSTGLFYRPGSYAETDEVIELGDSSPQFLHAILPEPHSKDINLASSCYTPIPKKETAQGDGIHEVSHTRGREGNCWRCILWPEEKADSQKKSLNIIFT